MKNQENSKDLQFVDISKWQTPYKDDGIDEGVRVDGVVIKSADGLRDFTKIGSWEYVQYWSAQWLSIAEFSRKWMYHWYQTEYSPVDQARLAVDICNKFPGMIDAWVVDFEYYHNIINAKSIQDLSTYTDVFHLECDVKLILYVNESAYKMIVAELGQDWADDQEWWIAGGKYYNTKLEIFPEESYFENLFNYPGRVAVQWSADGNQQADEHDFGDSELSSIDMNYIYFTPEEYEIWLGRVVEEEQPIEEGEEQMVIEVDSEGGGKLVADPDLIDRIFNDPKTVFNVNLNIALSTSLDGGVLTPPKDVPIGEEFIFPNTILRTVQHPTKAHGLLTTWRAKNAKGFPMFTAFPTDNPDHDSLRIKIPNGTQLLVNKVPVKGDSAKYASKIVDHDGYFAGLGAVDHKGEPMDVNKLYMREEWLI